MLRFQCEHCGRELVSRPENAGRSMSCPGCKKAVAIAATQAAPRAGRPGRMKGMLVVVLGLAVLAIAVAAGVWWFTSKGQQGATGDGPEVSDMALLPANAQSFATVRLAELYKMPAARDGLEKARLRAPGQETPVARLERVSGLKPEDIERVHVVAIDAEKLVGWIAARTVAPIDREKVLAKLTDPVENRHQGRRYYLGKNSDGQQTAIHFGGPNVIVIGSEEGMKLAMAQAARPVTDGALKAIIASVDTSKSQAIAGLNAQAGGLDYLKKQLPVKFESVEQIRVVRLTLDADDKTVTVVGAFEMPDENAARTFWGSGAFWAAATFGGTKLAVKKYWDPLRQEGGDGEKTAALLDRFVDSASQEAKGNEMRVTAKTQPDAIAAVLLYMLPAGK